MTRRYLLSLSLVEKISPRERAGREIEKGERLPSPPPFMNVVLDIDNESSPVPINEGAPSLSLMKEGVEEKLREAFPETYDGIEYTILFFHPIKD